MDEDTGRLEKKLNHGLLGMQEEDTGEDNLGALGTANNTTFDTLKSIQQ